MPFESLLVPLDFSPHSAVALDHAIEIAAASGGRLHLLHCYPAYVGTATLYGVAVPESFDQECRDAAMRETERWAQRAEAAGVAVETSVTPVPPPDSIVQKAEEIGADLIVMGSRGLSGLKHVWLGSVAERVLRLAPCPVLTVKRADGE